MPFCLQLALQLAHRILGHKTLLPRPRTSNLTVIDMELKDTTEKYYGGAGPIDDACLASEVGQHINFFQQ